MIEFINAGMQFDKYRVIDNMSFIITEGSAFALIGSNGAGKSTILRMLSGIYKPKSGRVLVDGEDVYDNPKAKEKVFFINDETIQFHSFTLNELKNYYKAFYSKFSDELFLKLIQKTGLPTDKKIVQFSKGMKRQAIVIIGLSCRPKYLLLDESFDGLDPTMRLIVKSMIFDAMSENNLTLVISSHNLKEINELCDKCIILHQGKIVSQGDTSHVDNMYKIQVAYTNEPEVFHPIDFKIISHTKSMSVHTFVVKGDKDKAIAYFKALKPILFDFVPLTLEETFIYEMEATGYGTK